MGVFVTYVLRSPQLRRFYTGHTDGLAARLRRHQRIGTRFTSRAQDWKVVYQREFATRWEAVDHERAIKKRGARSVALPGWVMELADGPTGATGACPSRAD